jgi:hypothetical protein
MAKVIGPFMSLDASGTLAGTITASKWKGRNYMRQRVIPSNPQSDAQTGVRASFAGANGLWKANLASLTSAFAALAAQTNVSPFNAFVSVTQKQYSKGFGAANSPDPTNAAPTNNDTDLAAVVEGKYVSLTWTDNTDADAWASNIYMKLTSDPTAIWTNLIGVIPIGTGKMTIGPLAAGTYKIGIASQSENGGFHALSTTVSAEVV